MSGKVTSGSCLTRRISARSARNEAVSNLPVTPARTCSQAAAQARAALRRFRDAASGDGGQPAPVPPGQQQQARLTVRLPLPSPKWQDDAVRTYSQGDWPGGIQQRFRRLRPLIEEHFLNGYSPEFVGMLESPADGIGVWRAAGGSMTVVCQVGNLNFSPFARLCAGEFGSSVLDPEHTLIAVNPTWTSSRDIGQFWDKNLKAQAADLIDDPAAWLPIYHLWDMRTAKGATGMLFRAWPHDWHLYSTCGHEDEPATALDLPPLLVAPERPSKEQQIEALNGVLQQQQQEERQKKQRRQRG